jgi:hypothetical protein
MRKPFIFLMTLIVFSGSLNAQSVKQPVKDTAKYRANDRLRTAGPKDGWKDSNNTKVDAIKAKADSIAQKRKIDSLKKRN